MNENHATATFKRDSSGLVREFRTFDVFVFNVVAFSLGLVLAVTPSVLGVVNPRAHILLVLTFGVVLTIFNGVTYGLFGAAMPRSGGDYVFIGRALRPSLGFTANWGLTWSQFLGMGVYTVWCIETALAPGLDIYGSLAQNATVSQTAAYLNNPVPKVLVGILLLASVFVITSFGMRVFKWFLNVLFFVALSGSLLISALLWRATPAGFRTKFNQGIEDLNGIDGAYQKILDLAASLGHDIGGSWSIWESFKALPMGYWVFIGFTFSVYVGNEVRKPERSQIVGILGALLFGYTFYMFTLGRYYYIVGRPFNNALANVVGHADCPVDYSSLPFLVSLLTDSQLSALLVSFSTFLWFYLLLFVMAQVCVRNLFAWGVDGILPEWVTRVSSRTANPTSATLVVAVAACIFLIIHAFFGIAFINYIALFSVCFLLAGVAAVAFPFRRREEFNRTHPVARIKIGRIPLIAIAGAGNILLFIWVLLMSLTNPGVSGVQGKLPVFILLAVYFSGFVVYELVKRIRKKRQNIDLDVLLEELPPD